MMNIVNTVRKPYPEFDDEGNYQGNREVTAVLTEDVNKQCAVYVGFAPRTEEGKKAVARSGSKQTFRQAKQWFPHLTKKQYRR